MTTDKTGAQTAVNAEQGKYTIAVEGRTVGHAAVADRDDQRIFYHTEIDDNFAGRGLATILVRQALDATRRDGKRIVAICPMVASVLDKCPEFSDITDPATPEIRQWAQTLPASSG
jgi:predicted GNAT family acetyltransferase